MCWNNILWVDLAYKGTVWEDYIPFRHWIFGPEDNEKQDTSADLFI